jgi:DNA helicase-2/ATP-dependent DNA helicase PcrA
VARRLLYVAITRAKAFCTLTHSATRMAGATLKDKELTPFLSTVSKTYPTLFVPKLQKITKATRVEMAAVLGRKAPDEALTAKVIEEQ